MTQSFVHLTDEGRLRPARQQRRIAKASALIHRWWLSLPDPKPAYVRPWVIAEATGLNVETLAMALRSLGWLRVQFRESRQAPRVFWVPPGFPNPTRPVGRPKGRPDAPHLPSERISTQP